MAEHFWYGVKTYKPHAIIVDSGSTDGGPYKLGLGKMTCSKESYVRDIGHMLDGERNIPGAQNSPPAAFHHGCKVLIGSAGGSGSDKHVDGLVAIVEEISAERGYSFKVGARLKRVCFVIRLSPDRNHQVRHRPRLDTEQTGCRPNQTLRASGGVS